MKQRRKIARLRSFYRSNKKQLMLTAMVFGASMPAWAAGGQTASKLVTLYNSTLQPIIRIVFLIGCAIAAIRVVLGMMNSGERGNIGTKIAWFVGGIIIYVLWETMLTDLGVNSTTGQTN